MQCSKFKTHKITNIFNTYNYDNKKFQLIHFCKDGNENYRTDYNTYKEAVNAMCNELQEEGNFMSPKDFDIIEVEEKSDFEKMMDKLCEELAHFHKNFKWEEICPTTDGRECAYLKQDVAMPNWSSVVIKKILNFLGNKASFNIASDVIDRQATMLIISR